MSQSEIVTLVLIVAAVTGGLWVVFKIIEVIVIAPLDRWQEAKNERSNEEFWAAFNRRPESGAALKRLEQEMEATLRDLGRKEMCFRFTLQDGH